MQLILYMMFAIRCFLTNACNCTTLDAAKVDSTFFFKYMLYISQNTDCGVWFVFVLLFFFTRNFFGWEIFSDLHCQKIGSSCFDISLKMWRQTRLVIIAAILVGFFFNLWDLWQIHSNQETRQLFGVKTKMSWFVIDFVGLAYTDKMNAINRFMRVFTNARDGLRQSWQWRFFFKKLARWYPNVAKTQFLMTPKV